MSQAIRRLPGQRRGFSLAELMAVLALLGALGALATVSVRRGLQSDATSGLAREVYTRLVQARFAAISGGVRVQVRLSPGPAADPALQVRAALEPGVAPSPRSGLGDGFGPVSDHVTGRSDGQIVGVAPTIDYDSPMPAPGASTQASLVFYPDGRVQLDGLPPHPGVTIYLADAQLLYKKRIVVLGRTGFARLLGN
jgi:prepilin-type N-terminal cleavage/methylation domain-containing protein